jgi:hypothetical protein
VAALANNNESASRNSARAQAKRARCPEIDPMRGEGSLAVRMKKPTWASPRSARKPSVSISQYHDSVMGSTEKCARSRLSGIQPALF